MFWTDWGEEPVIEIAQMDGSNRQIIVSSRIEWPNGLSIDREASRIYWVDGKHESVTLDSCNYNGGSRRTIVRGSSDNLEFPFGIVFFKGFVFWTDWILKGLYRARVSDNPDTSNELLIQQFAGARPFQPIVVSLKHLREGGEPHVRYCMVVGTRGQGGSCSPQTNSHLILPPHLCSIVAWHVRATVVKHQSGAAARYCTKLLPPYTKHLPMPVYCEQCHSIEMFHTMSRCSSMLTGVYAGT